MFARNLRARAIGAMCIVWLFAGCGFEKQSLPDEPPPPPAATTPSITAQPTSLSATAGQTVTFNVTAAGTNPLSYQWRRNGVDIAGATGASYTTPVTMADNGASYTVVITNSAGTVTSSAAVLTVTTPAGIVTSIEVDRSAALLTEIGQTGLLAARPVDGQGAPVAGSVSWQSSNPAAVSVDGAGRITANAIGSAMLFAEANGVRSQPVFVLVAEPQPGALVVQDSQVISVGSPVIEPGVAPGVGTQYEVTVSGIASAPAPGTVVLAAGDAAIAGKVVAARNEAGNLVLTLELAPLPDVLARYDFDWDIDLSTFPVDSIAIDEVIHQSSRGMQKARAIRPASLVNLECDGEFSANLVSTRISATPQVGARLQVASHRRDPSLPPGYAKIALVGSQGLKGTASIKFNPGFEGEITCVAAARLKVPVGGVASVLVMPALRIGLGFNAGGGFRVAEGELKAEGLFALEETLGVECTSNGCQALKEAEIKDKFELKKTVPSLHQMQVDLFAQFFGVAGIDAAFFFGLVDAEIIEARIGPKQTFELAHPDDQAHNPSLAANYHLNLDGVIGPGSSLRKAIETLIGDKNVTVNFDVPYSKPLATSPKGTFMVSSESVPYGQPVAFQVHLDEDSLTYPFIDENFGRAYNVKNVQIWRRKEPDDEFEMWQTLSASEGRKTFQYEWTPTSDDAGDYEFAAFVETELPVPLVEVTDDSKRPLHVRGPGWAGNITFTMEGTESTHSEFSDGGAHSSTTTTFTDSGTGSYRLETIAGAEGAPLLKLAEGSGSMTRGRVELADSVGKSNGCDFTLNQTRENVEQATLHAIEGSLVLISFLGDGQYQIMIPGLVGPSHGTDHVEAVEIHSGGPQCHNPAPTNTTTEFTGSLSSDMLIVTGSVGDDPTALHGTATVTVSGTPDRQYTVSWSLQQ